MLPVLCRETTGDYFNVSFSAPVIQFSFSPSMEQWDGQPALVQGRIWASFEAPNDALVTWYNATVRWIRNNFIRDHALGLEKDSIGPRAYEWFKTGGLLLPGFRPPLTAEWLDWAKAQNEHRGKLIADASSV